MAVTFSMEIEGKYPELKNYVERLEASPRLVRIDTMNLEKRSDNLVMNLTVLGVVPKK
jgi:Tfp pilus assembly protein PilO